MKRFKTLMYVLALSALTALSGAAFARPSEPVLNVVDDPVVTTSGKPLSAEELKQIITKAAQSKRWIVAAGQGGHLSASLSWKNNKHTIMVDIVCATNRYSILYKSSINMNYGIWDSQPVIHPYYNRYVKELREAIQAQALHQ